MNPEVWSQFMNMQAPMMQGMMTSYIEQSKNMFVQMQEQMQNQSKVDVQHVPVQAAGRVGAGKSNGFAAGRPRQATRRASVPRSSAARRPIVHSCATMCGRRLPDPLADGRS